MGDKSGIQWTDATWNPTTGCDKVSPGCKNCYAMALAKRMKSNGVAAYQRDGDPVTSGPGFGLSMHEDRLEIPLRWQKPRMIFVNSMSDLFHPEVTDEFIAHVFAVMTLTPQHTYQVLTKRPERMRDILSEVGFWGDVGQLTRLYPKHLAKTLDHDHYVPGAMALRNVWLGTSIELRTYVHRADVLRDTPAAIRFISAEPLLGPLIVPGSKPIEQLGSTPIIWDDGYEGPDLDLTDIDQVIVGGESGPGHRPIQAEWVRDLRDAAQDTRIADEQPDTAFFFKQWGGTTPKAGGRELDGRTWDEMPTPLTA